MNRSLSGPSSETTLPLETLPGATALPDNIAPRITGTHKSLHVVKVAIIGIDNTVDFKCLDIYLDLK